MSGFICGSYTSHVARSYFQALAGVYFPSEADEKNNMYKQNICEFYKMRPIYNIVVYLEMIKLF